MLGRRRFGLFARLKLSRIAQWGQIDIAAAKQQQITNPGDIEFPCITLRLKRSDNLFRDRHSRRSQTPYYDGSLPASAWSA